MGESARQQLLLEEASVAEEQPLCCMVYSPRTLPPRGSIFGHCSVTNDGGREGASCKGNEGQ